MHAFTQVLLVTLNVNVGLKVTMKSTDGLWVAITKSKIEAIHTNSKILERIQLTYILKQIG